jgi:phage tail sheath gpL-like
MAISFDHIPSNILVPLFYAEINSAQAAYFQQNQVSLIFGPMLPTGLAVPLQAVLVPQVDIALGLFGAGSILADMCSVFRKNDSMGELWCIPYLEDQAGSPATTTATVTVAAPGTSGAGTIYCYVAGMRIPVYIKAGMDAATIAASIVDAVTAQPFCLLTAAAGAAAGEVVFAARGNGALGNFIDLSWNYRGITGGEMMPAGVSVYAPVLSGGVGDMPVNDIVNAMADDPYDFICCPLADTTTFDAMDALMSDVGGRWAWDSQIYGGVFAARMASATQPGSPPDNFPSNVDFGRSRNGPHVYCLAHAENSLNPPWQRAAALTGQAAVALRNDPARALQSLPLIGIDSPPRGKDYRLGEKNTLLQSGMGVEETDPAGQVRISRVVSTYQKNSWGQPDPSWRDETTAYTIMAIVRRMRARILQKFPRHKLADDGTAFGAGQAVATPSIIRGELVALYSEMISDGWVENMEAFQAHLLVERDANDPNRVNVLLPPDLLNQLRILATKVEFRLQYPTTPPGGIPVSSAA